MKLVIKLGSTRLDQASTLREFAGELRQLLADGHRVTVVHGVCEWDDDLTAAIYMEGANGGSSLKKPEGEGAALMVQAGKLNMRIVGTLSKCGIAAIGLCGLDANLIRLRKTPTVSGTADCPLEVCAVDSFWLDTISKNGGVPVLVNLAAGPDQHCHLVNADQMAASCAVYWDADALIFLSECEGFVNGAGSISRWLNVNDLDALTVHYKLNGDMLSKLQASYYALKYHVHRTRILPLSDLKSLSMFYSSRIDSGTELILQAEEHYHL